MTPSDAVTLRRALVAREIQNREPLQTEEPYMADGEPLYIFLEVVNPTGDIQELTVVMHHLDRDRQIHHTVEVGPSRSWRTWVFHRMRSSQVGRWRVEIRNPAGELLGEVDFEVVRQTE